ncbi:hypothetical protein Mterra_00358 [Calidithermus terrae]|uniref:DUF305 domain-containing protein n=1 Tax=Calidithermus terrae TaxID=1408545 RepID=A0A399F386_9DEIN|nr:hypothetical protein Mterra_00358 [Calidithermus terrae]
MIRRIVALTLALGLALAQTDHSQHGGMPMKSMGALERLSGKDFDIAYMSMMIDHHKGAVEMAQAILKVSKDARVRKAAQDIVAVQNKEIGQLTAWLKGWYGVAPSRMYMDMMRGDMKAMMDAAMAGMKGKSPDRAFLEGMIPHHQDAIDMSELALKKANKPELKKFAREVIAVQSREIGQYREWLKTLAAAPSPYVAQLESPVRGLSAQEVEDLLAGRGAGYARTAELNGHPGPAHVLEFKEQLGLSPQQVAEIGRIRERMAQGAKALGARIVAEEKALSEAFAGGKITPEALQERLLALGALYAELRMVHLKAHLEVTLLLSRQQILRYNQLRGYGAS